MIRQQPVLNCDGDQNRGCPLGKTFSGTFVVDNSDESVRSQANIDDRWRRVKFGKLQLDLCPKCVNAWLDFKRGKK